MSRYRVEILRACGVDEIPRGEGRTAIVGGQRVAIFHTKTGWHCVDADCPHKGGPLADGIVADHTVICPLHQLRFDLLTGDALGHSCRALVTHTVEVRGRDVYVYVRIAASDPIAA
jgi:nitrite reductase (NADH) small subunit